MVGKHHSSNYKESAVKYYKKCKNLRKTCEIYECKKSTLQRWVKRYNNGTGLNRKIDKREKRIVTDDIIKFIKEQVRKEPTIILTQLKKLIKNKFKVDLTKMTIYRVINNNNITRKKLRKRYYPQKKDEKKDLEEYYSKIKKINKRKIISIDETSIYLNMTLGYGRSKKGYRVYKKTSIYPFKKYNMLCAIRYGKIVEYEIYKDIKGGIGKGELCSFIDKYINKKYKGNTLLLDNASFHRSKEVKDKIESTGNKFLYTVPYHPETNPIEEFFNQFKHYLKLESPQSYEEIVRVAKLVIKNKISKNNLENYIKHLYMRIK